MASKAKKQVNKINKIINNEKDQLKLDLDNKVKEITTKLDELKISKSNLEHELYQHYKHYIANSKLKLEELPAYVEKLVKLSTGYDVDCEITVDDSFKDTDSN